MSNFGDRAQLQEIAERGAKFAEDASGFNASTFRKMSPAERRIYRSAWFERLSQKMDRKAEGTSTDYANYLRSPEVAAQVKVLRTIDDPAARRLAEFIRQEARQTQVNRELLGGSKSVDKAADVADGTTGLAAARQATQGGTLWSTVSQSILNQIQRVGALTQKQSQYLARELTSMDPQQQAQFLSSVRKSMAPGAFRKVVRSVAPAISPRALTILAGGITAPAVSAQQRGRLE